MAFRPYYEDADEIPEALREHYAENDDGLHVLQLEGANGWAVEDVSKLRSTLGKLKDAEKKARGELQGFRQLERSPEDIQAALQQLEEQQANGQDESERIAALRRELEQVRSASQQELQKATQPLQEKLDRRTDQVRNLIRDNALTQAIASRGGKPKVLMPALKEQLHVEEDDNGNLMAVVVDDEGTPRVTGKDLQPMGIDALVDEYQADPDWAGAFPGTNNSGGGAPPSQGRPSGTPTPEQASQMSMAEYRKARAEGRL